MRSAPVEIVGEEHRGPDNRTAGGGSIAIKKSDIDVAKKGASVSCKGRLALAKPEMMQIKINPWKTILRHEGEATSRVHVWTSCSAT